MGRAKTRAREKAKTRVKTKAKRKNELFGPKRCRPLSYLKNSRAVHPTARMSDQRGDCQRMYNCSNRTIDAVDFDSRTFVNESAEGTKLTWPCLYFREKLNEFTLSHSRKPRSA